MSKIKEFHRTIFMVNNPTKGAMFGLSLQLLNYWMAPIYFFFMVSLCDLSKSTFDISITILGAVVLYSVVLTISSIIRLLIRDTKKGFVGILLAILSILFTPLLLIILLINYLKQKRFGWAILAGIAILACFSPLLTGSIFKYMVPFLLIVIATFAGTNKNAKFSWLFIYPILALTLTWGGLYIYQGVLQTRIDQKRVAISEMVTYPVTLAEYKKRTAEGLSLDAEPFKTLIDEDSSYEDSNYELFVEALNQLLELPVGKYANDSTPNEYLTGEAMRELSAFRKSVRHLSGQIIDNPHDKALVKQCNADIIKLRDWMLNSTCTLIATLVTNAIESIRIDALSYPLATGDYTTAEFNEMLISPVDWRKTFAQSIADESAYSGCLITEIINGTISTEAIFNVNLSDICSPVQLKVHLLKDHNFMLDCQAKHIAALEKGQPDAEEFKANSYYLSTLLLPSLERVKTLVKNNEDAVVMAQLSADIMEQYKTTGELPTSVELPLSPNGYEIHYQYGDIMDFHGDFYGFQLYTEADAGPENIYNVRLTKE